MKLISTLLIFLTLSTMSISAANPIALPAPEKTGGLPAAEAFSLRRSTREFNPTRKLPLQTVSNLLWSAAGTNRPDGHRTNPTALGREDITLYLFTDSAVYVYDHTANALKPVADGDHRALVAGAQDFVTEAPASVVIVSDFGKFSDLGEAAAASMGTADAGIVSQNINIFCAANGLATVTRASMDAAAIAKLLGLGSAAKPVLNNPVGYAK